MSYDTIWLHEPSKLQQNKMPEAFVCMTLSYGASLRDGLSGVFAALAMAGLSGIWSVPSYGIILLSNTVTV